MRRLFVALAVCILSAAPAFAAPGYKCKIEKFHNPISSEPWVKTYGGLMVGNEFLVNRLSGVMTKPFTNNLVSPPTVVDYGSKDNGFKAVTTLSTKEGFGRGSYIMTIYVEEFADSDLKPFVVTNNAEIFSGTCVHIDLP